VFQSVDVLAYHEAMSRFRHSVTDSWKAPSAGIGAIADHFRLPWRFHARIVAATGPGFA
jgi:hypothetical protein